jgi:hypothetical protein
MPFTEWIVSMLRRPSACSTDVDRTTYSRIPSGLPTRLAAIIRAPCA